LPVVVVVPGQRVAMEFQAPEAATVDRVGPQQSQAHQLRMPAVVAVVFTPMATASL
jgi:hypothetical protein